MRRHIQRHLARAAFLGQIPDSRAVVVDVQSERTRLGIFRHREIRRDIIAPRILRAEADFHGINRKRGVGRLHLLCLQQIGRSSLQFCQLGLPECIKVGRFCLVFPDFGNARACAAVELLHAVNRLAVLVASGHLKAHETRNADFGCQRKHAGFAVGVPCLGCPAVVRRKHILEFRTGSRFAVGSQTDGEFHVLAHRIGKRVLVGHAHKQLFVCLDRFNVHLRDHLFLFSIRCRFAARLRCLGRPFRVCPRAGFGRPCGRFGCSSAPREKNRAQKAKQSRAERFVVPLLHRKLLSASVQFFVTVPFNVNLSVFPIGKCECD